MKRFSIILVLGLTLAHTLVPSVLVFAENPTGVAEPASEAPADSLRQLGREAVLDAGDEVFEGLQSLGTASCDVLSAVNEVTSRFSIEWSFGETIAELLTLIKNRAWRELTWAVIDEHQRLSDELIKLKKRKCLIDAAILGSESKGAVLGTLLNENDPSEETNIIENYESIEQNLAMRIAELEGKLDYFGMQRWNLFLGRPIFGAFNYNPETEQGKKDIAIIDSIFYFIMSPSGLFGDFSDQIATGMVQFLKRTLLDGVSFIKNIPDTCFMLGQVLDQTIFHFALYGNKLSNLAADKPIDLGEYVEKNSPFLGNPDIDYLCKKGTEVTEKELMGKKEEKKDLNEAEQRYQAFIDRIQGIFQDTEKPLIEVQEAIDANRARMANAKTDGEKKKLQEERDALYKRRAYQLAIIEYYTLVLSVAPPPGSDSLSKLGAALTSLVEAILALTDEDDEKKKKKTGKPKTAEEKKKEADEKKKEEEKGVAVRAKENLSKRVQKVREKKLQDICARLEAMYRKSGRDTSDLPIIGYVNETTYCQAQPECEELLSQDTPGLSNSAQKFEECLIEKEVKEAKKADKERKERKNAKEKAEKEQREAEEAKRQAERKAVCEEDLKKETIDASDYEDRLDECIEKKEKEEEEKRKEEAKERKLNIMKEEKEKESHLRKQQRKLEDIGVLLEQGAYQSLLAVRDQHLKSLREQYGQLYETQDDATKALTDPLKDLAMGYFDQKNQENYTAPKKNEKDSGSKKSVAPIHYNVLGKVYDDLYYFMSQQGDFSCSAPEKAPGD